MLNLLASLRIAESNAWQKWEYARVTGASIETINALELDALNASNSRCEFEYGTE